MLDLKPYGAFIENTIRPMIEETQKLLSDLYGYGLHLNKEDIHKVAKFVADKHIKTVILQSIVNVVICALICLTLYLIYR